MVISDRGNAFALELLRGGAARIDRRASAALAFLRAQASPFGPRHVASHVEE